VSYRHSSYRKLRRAIVANTLSRPVPVHAVDRIAHWEGEPSVPKPPGWGKPKKKVG
jgi:hypothetical protein